MRKQDSFLHLHPRLQSQRNLVQKARLSGVTTGKYMRKLGFRIPDHLYDRDDFDDHNFPTLLEITIEEPILPSGTAEEWNRSWTTLSSVSQINFVREYDQARIDALEKLAHLFNGTIFKTKKTNNFGEGYPAVIFLYNNHRYGIAECPIKGNATYVIREDFTPGKIEEMLLLTKKQALDLGAVRLYHTSQDIFERICEKIQELEVIR